MDDTVIVLSVHMDAVAGREQELEKELHALLDPTRNEPGCLAYEVHRDPERPGKFMFYEKFQNQAALDAHLDSPHFRKFVNYRSAGEDPVALVNVTTWSAIA
jgi:quinol monooxygenase YgiN